MLQKTVGASNYIALGLFRSKKEVGVKEVKEHNTVVHKCMKVPTEQNCAFYTKTDDPLHLLQLVFPSTWMMWNPLVQGWSVGQLHKHGKSITTRSSAIKVSEPKGNLFSEHNMQREKRAVHSIKLLNVMMWQLIGQNRIFTWKKSDGEVFHVSPWVLLKLQRNPWAHTSPYTLRNKGTKAVTGAVPFQKVHFCTY